jgi:hypothetical protein
MAKFLGRCRNFEFWDASLNLAFLCRRQVTVFDLKRGRPRTVCGLIDVESDSSG